MKRRDFFKATAGVIVSAAAGGLLDVHPGTDLPELPDPDYDKIVTSAFPLSDSQEKIYTIGAEDFQFWNLSFPESGGEARMPGYTHIKDIVAAGVDQRGCQVRVLPSGKPYPQGAPEFVFETPIEPMSVHMDNLWLQCQDGVIKVEAEALMTIHLWRPKLA